MTQSNPIAEADALLRSTDTAELLTKAFHLTHRIGHSLTDGAVADLRAQRDLISAEIVRRTTKGA